MLFKVSINYRHELCDSNFNFKDELNVLERP